ncbi:MAG TPA: hypothetical protein VN782_12225 [Usitatibacter sp.]|nr:hypothetical protein [Usitatibacter sp.]
MTELPGWDLETDLKRSDAELGAALIARFFLFMQEQRGIPRASMTRRTLRAVMPAFLKAASGMDGDSASNAALEKAVRRGAKDDLAAAGRIFRAHVIEMVAHRLERNQAERIKRQAAEVSRAQDARTERHRRNQRKAVAAVVKYSAEMKARWLEIDRELVHAKKVGYSQRAEIIRRRCGLPPQAARSIRRHISKPGPHGK